jgi:hypothetical protein
LQQIIDKVLWYRAGGLVSVPPYMVCLQYVDFGALTYSGGTCPDLMGTPPRGEVNSPLQRHGSMADGDLLGEKDLTQAAKIFPTGRKRTKSPY